MAALILRPSKQCRMSGQTLPVPPGGTSITIRRAKPQDAPVCGRVCFDAFYKISTSHGFPCDFPSPEVAVGLLSMMFSHPGFYCVVAESDGCVVGSNCLDERSAIAGLGPITVDPSMQDRGVGRKLMEAVLVRARERNFPGVRLLQSAFHNRSVALYSRLGFDVREPVSVMQGAPPGVSFPGYVVRPAKADDAAACDALCRRVHGFERSGEVTDAISQNTARVVEHLGRITGYATGIGYFAHAASAVDTLVGREIVDEPSLMAINRECQPPRPRIQTVDCPSSIGHRTQQVRCEDVGRFDLHHHRVAAKPDPDSVPYIGMSAITADKKASRDFEAFI